MTEDQELFWKILRGKYPSEKTCYTCHWGDNYSCHEPEYLKSTKRNCGGVFGLSEWVWNKK